MEKNEMGSITDWKIRTFQKETGIQPATGAEAELLEAMSNTAFELIKIIELERSGIRDGDGHWYGADATTETVRELRKLCDRWFARNLASKETKTETSGATP